MNEVDRLTLEKGIGELERHIQEERAAGEPVMRMTYELMEHIIELMQTAIRNNDSQIEKTERQKALDELVRVSEEAGLYIDSQTETS